MNPFRLSQRASAEAGPNTEILSVEIIDNNHNQIADNGDTVKIISESQDEGVTWEETISFSESGFFSSLKSILQKHDQKPSVVEYAKGQLTLEYHGIRKTHSL